MYGQPIPNPQTHVAWQQHLDSLLRTILKEIQLIRQQTQQETADVWREHNPDLAKRCGAAFDKLAEIQNKFVEQMVDEIENLELGYDGAYALREFTDRFGMVSNQLTAVMNTLRMLRS